LFAGILDSSGDWPYFEQLLNLKRERPFALFAGNDLIAAQAIRAGADGLITGSACAIPELAVKLFQSITAGKQSQADTLNAGLLEFAAWNERFPEPVGIKRAVEIRGQ